MRIVSRIKSVLLITPERVTPPETYRNRPDRLLGSAIGRFGLVLRPEILSVGLDACRRRRSPSLIGLVDPGLGVFPR